MNARPIRSWRCAQPSLLIENLLCKLLLRHARFKPSGWATCSTPQWEGPLWPARPAHFEVAWSVEHGPTEGLEGNLIRHVWCYFNASTPGYNLAASLKPRLTVGPGPNCGSMPSP